MLDSAAQRLRRDVFGQAWPLDDEIAAVAATIPTHAFLNNPASQNSYVYLTRFVKALAEQRLEKPFAQMSVLDWGCGKGQVTKLIRDLGPASIRSCDVVSDKDDSAFGQATPLIEHFNIEVDPLEHPYILPYADDSFDILISMGVLEHVPNDRASLKEIHRVLRPGGMMFCFYLPTTLSWTQKIAHMRGNFYHDRLYNRPLVEELLAEAHLDLVDFWFRQLLPKNTVRYPKYRLFERLDQAVTEHTPARHFATNVEFVAAKPR